MPATVAQWEEMMIERWAFARTGGSQTLVQGRLKVRTGEMRTLRRGEAERLERRIKGVGK